MADYAERYADKKVEELSKEINRTYLEARSDMWKKLQAYIADFLKQDSIKRKQLKDGKISQDAYENWIKGKVFSGQKWIRQRQDLSKVLIEADKQAANIVNNGALDVLKESANYCAYDIERNTGGAVSFDIYDERSVTRLIAENPELLPRRVVNGQKAAAWNVKRISNAITQGIIQGESIPEISKRIARDTGISAGKSSIMYARTAMTGAHNAGRIERMNEAEALGIEIKKKWLATNDKRTRDTHGMLDGQERKPDEPFEVKGMEIMFPGDPNAEPELVYNCRCTLVNVYPKYEKLHKKVGLSYAEWKATKVKDIKDSIQRSTVVNGKDISSTWTRREKDFEFEIEDIMNAQGFDGVPRIVSAEEFDKLVKEANGGDGFIAQRTYSAPDQETLDAYREMLYHGKWYVDCSTGGAQYGQGMYCAADYTGNLSDGIKAEMEHYQELGDERLGAKYNFGEIQKEMDKVTDALYDKMAELGYSPYKTYRKGDEIYDLIQKRDRILHMDIKEYVKEFHPEFGAKSYVETLTLDKSAKIITFDDLLKQRGGEGIAWRDAEIAKYVEGKSEEVSAFFRINIGKPESGDWNLMKDFYQESPDKLKELENKFLEIMNGYSDVERKYALMDEGAYAALKGYDAINAENHGESGSYTVILNRTKVIIKGE